MRQTLHNTKRFMMAGLAFKLPGWGLPSQFSLFCAILFLALSIPSLFAEITVTTLGGGPLAIGGPAYGDQDGDTLQQAQFNFPAGCVTNGAGSLLVADRNNGKIRKLDLAANRTRMFLSGLTRPVALAFDSKQTLFIVCQGNETAPYNGAILKRDQYGFLETVATNLANPSAIAVDAKDNIYFTESVGALGGAVRRIDATTGLITLITNGLNKPLGIAVLQSGALAVSESGAHSILLIDSSKGATVQRIGTGTSGFRDGPAAVAQFNAPHQLVAAPGGAIVVADRGNHRVRVINPSGIVTTLYGIDSTNWITGIAGVYPGWEDGDAEFAEAREPVGVAVDAEGTVYATEVYYHIIREATGAGLAVVGGGPGTGTEIKVKVPIISPNSGYYPMGQTILVTNPNTNAFFTSRVYYTTDGSDPTTNSFEAVLTNNVGAINWRENDRDLASLRLKAFLGSLTSDTVRGQSVTNNSIGVSSDMAAGIGATVVMPVVVNLRTNQQLQSLQFRLEITPTNNTNAIAQQLQFLPINPDTDFIRLAAPAQNGKAANYQSSHYTITNGVVTRGVAISFIGSNANFSVGNFAVVALLAAQIPAQARHGDQYLVSVVQPSGTADAWQIPVAIAPLANRTVTVSTNLGYVVGDSAVASWYNAGGFGDGDLNNNDVNNAFNASLGVRAPFAFTDLFDAMDAFPLDSAAAAGGDGQIRFLDWQTILKRSLRLPDPEHPAATNNWKRFRAAGGMRVAVTNNLNAQARLPAQRLSAAADELAWFQHATISAATVENVMPGAAANVPVSIKVAAGYQLAGLQFRITIIPQANAPMLRQPPEFIPSKTLPAPSQSQAPEINVLLCGWSLVPSPAFNPPLQNTNDLGTIKFLVPTNALPGQYYTLRFGFADGAPDLSTQYDIQTVPGRIWVQSPAQFAGDYISDEWRIHFFGSITNAMAAASADADADGFANFAEYLAGTNPIQKDWQFKLAPDGFVLRWFAERNYKYQVERSLDLANWAVISSPLQGNDSLREFTDSQVLQPAQFYRVRDIPLNTE